MAPEKKVTKRKAASAAAAAVSDPPAKKSKKAESKAVESPKQPAKPALKKSAAAAETNGASAKSSLKLNGQPAREVKPRKRAADFLSDDEDAETKKTKSAKKDKKGEQKDGELNGADAKKSSKPKKKQIVNEDFDVSSSDASEQEDDEAEDDQTAALIKGFESSGDEEDVSGDEGFDPKNPVPKIPDSKKVKRKLVKKQKSIGEPEETGTVYVGRIPHGFYEHQMRAYFSQFGEITRLRLSRNRVTGRSKHYAFIEFASSSVAKIVAETMNNYLMYGHILKCKFVPNEQLHPDIWKGANRRFKKTPWNKIEKKRLESGKAREKWTKSIEQEQKRRIAKLEKLKELGYEFEIPELKSVDAVPVQTKEKPALKAPEAVEAEEPKTIEAPSQDAEKSANGTPKSSDKKKGKKTKGAEPDPVESKSTDAVEATVSPAAKKAKKTEKAKKKSKA
ncbi:rRNA processing protein gar2 [Paecilomyces variotii No. 5]|uniref:rRNA processing protein gar2 n=1 Tax=Byssochlamys spectabilis (strain No. 5 / NBRC 109023) TaxID=1356009 RepID=V5G3R7_BYSSN|nr:rRNA processing protein gar2 [Paecilomyces variotii No. 5]